MRYDPGQWRVRDRIVIAISLYTPIRSDSWTMAVAGLRAGLVVLALSVADAHPPSEQTRSQHRG